MLLTRSMSTGREVCVDGQQVLALALAVLDLLQRRSRLGPGGPRLRRRALDELLADQRLRADRAGRVLAEVLEAGLGDVEDDGGLLRRRHVERLDLADLDARDLDVLAGDDGEGVAEDRADLVAVGLRRSRRRPRRAKTIAGRPRAARTTESTRLMARASTWVGSQSRSLRRVAERRRAVRRGLAGSARAALELVVDQPERRGAASVERREHLVVQVERVEDRLDAGEVAVGVVVGGALAEVADPADEVRRVRPDEVQHRRRLAQRGDAVGERGLARPAPGAGALRSSSIRSLFAPGRRIRWRRSRIVGRASSTSGRSSRRNGARSFVAGLDASTSGSRSSSVARRFDERRVGLAQRARQQAERLRERLVLRGDRAGRRVGVRDEAARGRRGARRAR